MRHHAPLPRRHAATLLAAALALLVAFPAVAGDKAPCDQPLELCLKKMVEKVRTKGWVGIEIDQQEDGTFNVTRIFPDSPAAASGLRAEDRILALDGVFYATADRAAIERAYGAMKPGRTIVYTVRRGGRQLEIPIELGRVPEHVLAQWIGQHLLHGHGQQAMVEKERDGDS